MHTPPPKSCIALRFSMYFGGGWLSAGNSGKRADVNRVSAEKSVPICCSWDIDCQHFSPVKSTGRALFQKR